MTEPKLTALTAKKWREPFLEALAQHGNVSRAARAAKISRVMLYRDKNNDPDFAQAWADAQAIGLDSLEDVANVRARKDSDTLLIFLLKAHRPEKYRERYEIGGPNGGPIQYQQVFDHTAAITGLAPRPIPNHQPPGTDEGGSDGSAVG